MKSACCVRKISTKQILSIIIFNIHVYDIINHHNYFCYYCYCCHHHNHHHYYYCCCCWYHYYIMVHHIHHNYYQSLEDTMLDWLVLHHIHHNYYQSLEDTMLDWLVLQPHCMLTTHAAESQQHHMTVTVNSPSWNMSTYSTVSTFHHNCILPQDMPKFQCVT